MFLSLRVSRVGSGLGAGDVFKGQGRHTIASQLTIELRRHPFPSFPIPSSATFPTVPFLTSLDLALERRAWRVRMGS